MNQFFMKDCKNIPKFSARAVTRTETMAAIFTFLGSSFVVIGGSGAIEVSGVTLTLVAIATALMGVWFLCRAFKWALENS